jgi:DNA-binding MarR family transcriptional regulator
MSDREPAEALPLRKPNDGDLGMEHLAKSARLLAWTSRSLERACARTGLTLAKYRVLFLLHEGTLRSTELAILARVGAPTVTSLTESLARAGLLERLPSPSDRRGVLLRLTEAGAEMLARTERALAEEIGRLLDLLTDGYAMDGVAAIYESVAARCRFRATRAAADVDPLASSFDGETTSSMNEVGDTATDLTF